MNTVEYMQIMATPSKPRSEEINPEITRLPVLTPWRKLFRRVMGVFLRVLVGICVRVKVTGRENMPAQGPLLIVSNHLGDADVLVGLAHTRLPVEIVVKSEFYHYPFLGAILEAYGVIWIHRGQPDRRALRAILDGLEAGRVFGIAPEGRESVTGGLEEGTGGAAYLAVRSKAPLFPVTFTGTENWRVLGNLKRFKRTPVTLTMGPVFHLEEYPQRREAVEQGTEQIMNVLASQLPPEYRGVYNSVISPG
jgi:1-acyl-sn-glycerol-3-phosphate acyltransferase